MTSETESPLTFPCDFVIKVFGNKNDAFESAVMSIINQHCPDVAENAYNYRPSKDEKYLAISANIHVDSREQLDNIYRELSANPNVLMVL